MSRAQYVELRQRRWKLCELRAELGLSHRKLASLRARGQLHGAAIERYLAARAERRRLRELAAAHGVTDARRRKREQRGWDSERAATEPLHPNGGRRTRREVSPC
jgi:hypothetical protein